MKRKKPASYIRSIQTRLRHHSENPPCLFAKDHERLNRFLMLQILRDSPREGTKPYDYGWNKAAEREYKRLLQLFQNPEESAPKGKKIERNDYSSQRVTCLIYVVLYAIRNKKLFDLTEKLSFDEKYASAYWWKLIKNSDDLEKICRQLQDWVYETTMNDFDMACWTATNEELGI